MAFSNTTTLLALITLFLMVSVNAENSVSFSFDKFYVKQENLILQGSASINNNVLKLTQNDYMRAGRALFYAPVQLWESPEVVASFETNFTFCIKSTFDSIKADGLAFFIANPDSQIPPDSAGKFLGLFPNQDALNNEEITTSITEFTDKVVAVEFDTFPNPDLGDPYYTHIGIDVNSIRSKKTTEWDSQNGKIATAHISYNSLSKKLTVVVSYPKAAPVTLSYDIALNTVLPKWVRVGFSAATGLLTQSNTILSWSFTSRLDSIKPKNQDIYIATVV